MMLAVADIDMLIFAIAAFVAVVTLSGMMRNRRDQIVRELSIKAEEERQRQEAERRANEKKNRKEKSRTGRVA